MVNGVVLRSVALTILVLFVGVRASMYVFDHFIDPSAASTADASVERPFSGTGLDLTNANWSSGSSWEREADSYGLTPVRLRPEPFVFPIHGGECTCACPPPAFVGWPYEP